MKEAANAASFRYEVTLVSGTTTDPVTGLMAATRIDAATSGTSDTNGRGDGTTSRADTTDRMASILSGASADGNKAPDAKTLGIREHMEIVGSDGAHVGTVDHVEDGALKLTKSDVDAGGRHHRLSMSLVASVNEKVHLRVSGQSAREQWQTVVK